MGAALVALAFGTVAYSRFWSDDVTLFRRAAAAVPESTKAHHKLGEELLRRGDVGDALRSLRRALEIAPDNVYAAETLQQARSEVMRRCAPRPSRGAIAGSESLPRDPDILLVVGAPASPGGTRRSPARRWRASWSWRETASPPRRRGRAA